MSEYCPKCGDKTSEDDSRICANCRVKTDTELRELDEWLFKTLFKMTRYKIDKTSDGQDIWESLWLPPECPPTAPHDDILEHCHAFVPQFTTDPAAAMQVLEKCAEKVGDSIRYRVNWSRPSGKHGISCNEVPCVIAAATLTLAICLFARELFKEDAK